MQEGTTVKKSFSKGKKIKFFFFTLLFLVAIIFILGEILLYFFHYQSYSDRMAKFTVEQAKWWTCDSINGPRYVANKVGKAEADFFKNETWYYNRLNIVNNEGYHDKDDFKELQANDSSVKILMAGDSFTWGASSDVDSSYVETFERDMKKAYPSVVWNTGIPATGTNHALFTVKKYLPVQKSNYVVLGFFVANDFLDNLLPYNKLVFNNQASCYKEYDYDKNFNPYVISKSEAYKKATGSYPLNELNVIQKILIKSRFISFISDLKDKLVNRISGNKAKTLEKEYTVTKDYLKQLNDYVKQQNAELIVLVIPALNNIKEKDVDYNNAIKILNELSVNYIEPINVLKKEDYKESSDGHWNNSGHIISGHELSKYLLNKITQKKQKP